MYKYVTACLYYQCVPLIALVATTSQIKLVFIEICSYYSFCCIIPISSNLLFKIQEL